MTSSALRYLDYSSTPTVSHEDQFSRHSNLFLNVESDTLKLTFIQDNAFTQSDLVDTRDDQVQELINRIGTTPVISHHEKLANRLVSLFGYAKEETPLSPGISIDSLSSFYDFLIIYNNLKAPSLSLTPDHNIYASWKEKNRLFSLHFLADRDVRFVLFKPNKKHPKRKIRISGTATVDTLMEIVMPGSLEYWLFNER